MTIEKNVLTAEEGKVLTNGSTYSQQVWLGINDSVNNWWEVDTPEDFDEVIPISQFEDGANEQY